MPPKQMTGAEKARGRARKKAAIQKASGGKRLSLLNAKIDRSQLSLKEQERLASNRVRTEGHQGVTKPQAMAQIAIAQIAKQERAKKKGTTKPAGTAGRGKRAVAREARAAFRRTFRKS